MVRTRFIGSGRKQEGGFLGTHKQDFEAHRTGGDWRHDAENINMNPVIGPFPGDDVQETLELISTYVSGLSVQNLESVLSVGNISNSYSKRFLDWYRSLDWYKNGELLEWMAKNQNSL